MIPEMTLSWPWYIARASGLVAFLFLYLSIFFALAIRLNWMRKLVKAQWIMPLHQWFASQALIFTCFHLVALYFDDYLRLSVLELVVPFASHFEANLIAFGILAFYLMILLVATSYFRRYLPYRLWRAAHFLNVVLYGTASWHAYFLGTDFKNHPKLADVFIGLNQLLFILLLVNFVTQYRAYRQRRLLQNLSKASIVSSVGESVRT